MRWGCRYVPVRRCHYCGPMADDHVWTAQELEQLSPTERQRLLDERVVTDLTTLSPDYVDRLRREGRKLMEQRGSTSRADGG